MGRRGGGPPKSSAGPADAAPAGAAAGVGGGGGQQQKRKKREGGRQQRRQQPQQQPQGDGSGDVAEAAHDDVTESPSIEKDKNVVEKQSVEAEAVSGESSLSAGEAPVNSELTAEIVDSDGVNAANVPAEPQARDSGAEYSDEASADISGHDSSPVVVEAPAPAQQEQEAGASSGWGWGSWALGALEKVAGVAVEDNPTERVEATTSVETTEESVDSKEGGNAEPASMLHGTWFVVTRA